MVNQIQQSEVAHQEPDNDNDLQPTEPQEENGDFQLGGQSQPPGPGHLTQEDQAIDQQHGHFQNQIHQQEMQQDCIGRGSFAPSQMYYTSLPERTGSSL